MVLVFVFGGVIAIGKCSLISPWGNAEEQTNYFQVARNFNAYGFLNSAFLQDLSTSSNPADHPYVYTHEPSGPEVLIALLTRFVGERYGLIRVLFLSLFVSGYWCYLRFAQLIA